MQCAEPAQGVCFFVYTAIHCAIACAGEVRLEVFRQHYNDDRPHSRLGYQTPAEFKRAWAEAQTNGQEFNIPT